MTPPFFDRADAGRRLAANPMRSRTSMDRDPASPYLPWID